MQAANKLFSALHQLQDWTTMAPKSKANGTTSTAIATPVETIIETPRFPAVVGINFGNTYASIAVLTKDGLAECIANEDGERQIACAIAFHGEEMYIGSQAKQHLVKNSQNTITGFRNLLGKKFSHLPKIERHASAPVIEHPNILDEPAYTVQVLVSSPTPLPTSIAPSAANSTTATPRSEPTLTTRTLTVSEVNTIFIQSLIKSAEDFLGRKVTGAVLSVPYWFDDAQRLALKKAAENAGVQVLQFLDEPAAVVSSITSIPPTVFDNPSAASHRNQLVVDLGASSLSLTLLSIRDDLAYAIAHSDSPDIKGEQLDDALITFFAKEFTKKNKVDLKIVPAVDPVDKRAEAKLRLAVEHTKRTISASPGAATCSVESLKDGIDYTGSINRLRFDLLAKPVYTKVCDAVKALVESSGLDLFDIDEVVYVGGSACLPGLDSALIAILSEDVVTPFTAGTLIGGGVGDPTIILARGCALQAKVISSLTDSEEDQLFKAAFERGHTAAEVEALTQSIGLSFPATGSESADYVVLRRETALPARRTVTVKTELADGSNKVAFEVRELKENWKIEKITPPKPEAEEGEEEDEEEPEEEEIKSRVIEKGTFFSALSLTATLAAKDAKHTHVQVSLVIERDGSLEVTARELGDDGKLGEPVSQTISVA